MFPQAEKALIVLAQETGVLPEHWWVWGLFIVGLFLLMILPRRLAKRSRLLDEATHKMTPQESLRRSMDQLLVELQETAREINASIDTKMIALNRLIEEADRRIETLKELRRPGAESTPEPEQKPLSEEAIRRRELEREIYRLADEGKTELEIARMTGTPRGEVELVLSLRTTPGVESSTEDGKTS
jgi:hypothetical protein